MELGSWLWANGRYADGIPTLHFPRQSWSSQGQQHDGDDNNSTTTAPCKPWHRAALQHGLMDTQGASRLLYYYNCTSTWEQVHIIVFDMQMLRYEWSSIVRCIRICYYEETIMVLSCQEKKKINKKVDLFQLDKLDQEMFSFKKKLPYCCVIFLNKNKTKPCILLH